jgi:hypothetical protein
MDLGYVDSFVYQHYMPGPFALYYPWNHRLQTYILTVLYSRSWVSVTQLSLFLYRSTTMKEDHNPFEHEWSGSEWDHMSPWQRKLFVVFIFCIILWGTPVYESMLNVTLYSGVVMPIAAVVGVISGMLSDAIPMIIKSLSEK